MPAQRRLVHILHGTTLALLALHIYVVTLPPTPTPLPAPQDPESAWWGFWPVTYLPTPALVLGVGLVLLAVLWGQRHLRAADLSARRDHLHRPLLLWAGIAALLLAAFFRYPIVHTRWGDAYILAHGLAWPDPAQRLTHSWQAPLDVWLHSQVWLRFHQTFGWQDAMPVYRLLSPLAGLGYLVGVLLLARDERLAPNGLTFLALTSLGAIQLFFGYVENYSFAAAGILLYLWLGVRLLQGRGSLWTAAALLGVTIAFHPSALVLGPSLLYLGWRQRHTHPGVGPVRAFMEMAVPIGLILGGVWLLMESGGHGLAALLGEDRPGGGDARWFVPLFQTSTRWEHYTMFSLAHLRDFLNEQILVAPGVFPGLIVLFLGAAWTRRLRALLQDPTGRFLLWAGACHLALTWIWNPDYGGQRDWDLFSLAGIPVALLFVWLAPRVLTHPRLRTAGLLPVLLFQALHTAAWIYQNRLPWEWPS